METALVAVAAAMLGVFATVLAARLARARSRRRLAPARRRIDEHLAAISATLARVSTLMNSTTRDRREEPGPTLDFAAYLEQLVAQAAAVTGAQAVAVRVAGPGGAPVVASYGTNDGAALLETALGPPDARPFRALTINWTYGPAADEDGEAYSSALVVPVVEDGVTTGALVAYAGPLGGFESEHLRALRVLADEATAGIANARRFTELGERSLTDPLTGIRNRSGYELELEREVARAHRTGRPLSLLLVELRAADPASAPEESSQADSALQDLAALVQRTARAADIPCRRRARELAIVLPETKDDGARRFYARLRREASATFGKEGRTTIAVGLVEWRPDETSVALDTRAAAAVRRGDAAGAATSEGEPATPIAFDRPRRRQEPDAGAMQAPTEPRPAVLEGLAGAIGEARRRAGPLTVAVLEIDDLRSVEERTGKGSAPALRAHVAARLDDCADEGRVVTRLGADRFAIVFPQATVDQARSVLAVLQASLEIRSPVPDARITVSAGIGALAEADDAPGLLRRAEEALREARASGGGSVVVAGGP